MVIKGEKSKENKNRKTKNKFNIKENSLISKYLSFYKENLNKKHIIIYILAMVIFLGVITADISKVDVTNSFQNMVESKSNVNNILISLKSKILLVFLVVFAGITPYVNLPILGLASPLLLAKDIVAVFSNKISGGNMICMSIGSIVEIFGIALAIATGIYYCNLTTKKFRYTNSKSFGILDVKKAIYTIKKDKNKIEDIDYKIEEKNKKVKELNVKIPYKNIGIFIIISEIIVVIGALISMI